MPDDDDGHEEPSISRSDKTLDVARSLAIAVVAALPGAMSGQGLDAGTFVAAGLDEFIPRVWERRLQRFVSELADRLRQVEARWDDAIATAVALGLRSAITSDDDKITYLANAVANVATEDEWEHDAASILLRYVGDLTATHLRVLDLAADPSAWVKRTGVLLDPQPAEDGYRYSDAVRQAFASAGKPINDAELIVGDLQALGILDMYNPNRPDQTPPEFKPEQVSALGHRIHRFVTWKLN